jgi:putative heme-binding domain-containing protein
LLLGVWFFFEALSPGFGASPRVPWTSNRVVGSPNPPAPYTVERHYPKLKFDRPVDIALIPGSDRLFVLEQGGKLHSFPDRFDVQGADLVFDFRPRHQPFDSAYAIAFHPKFAENRFIFVCYVEPGGRTNGSFVSRFTLRDSTPPTIDPESEKVIIRWLSGGHNGCTLAFGNDGFLYLSTGDAASPDPPDIPFNTGQDISDLLSSILRLDVDGTEGTNNYAVPRDNPFVKTPGARPEVYAFGLRNPWRMSIDRATGDLWIGDVGWEQWEMIYRAKPGGNYGWPITEGPNTHVRGDVKPGPGPILPPLVALPHSDAASITGGLVYHGKKLAKLTGAYLYGDWETGKFWALRHDGDRLVSNDELCDTTLKPASFGEDRDKELLILDYNGGIYRLAPSTAPPANLAFPLRLSETGIFSDLTTLAPAPGVVPYRVNAEMWSDYASAERLLGVPGDGAIVTADGRETIVGRMWNYPSNTVFARTLALEMERGRPATRRRIETQLLHFDGQGWNAYTFRWNAAQADAELVPGEGTNDVFTVVDAVAPGGRREIHWRFVGRAECLRCHNAWAGDTLSFNWPQLNTPGTNSELRRLEQLGVLRVKKAPDSMPRLANPYDPELALDDRARTWLHVNCSTCHRNGAGGDVPSWFNFDQPIEKSRAYDTKPVRGDFSILAARVIAPGDPYRSTLFYRINTEGSGRMPHIGSRLVDEAGVRLLRDWIHSLPAKDSADGDVIAARKLEEENAALLARWRGDTRRNDIAKLLSSMNGCLALLGEATDPALRRDAGAAVSAHTNVMVRDLFQRLLPPDQRRRTLGSDFNPQTVLALSGNATRGRDLFLGMSQCSRCHVCNGAGRAFGPDLTGIGRKYTRAVLLEQILFPSKVVAPEHKTTTVTLLDDTELNGFVLRRTTSEIVLRDETLTERTLKLSALKETRESTLSAMPEGLLAPLTAQEAADLLEYLCAENSPAP